jgi:hypothetical protein
MRALLAAALLVASSLPAGAVELDVQRADICRRFALQEPVPLTPPPAGLTEAQQQEHREVIGKRFMMACVLFWKQQSDAALVDFFTRPKAP